MIIHRIRQERVSKQLRLRVLKRDNYTCQSCHKRTDKPHVDHIVPQRNGGLPSLQNLKTICHKCHIEKHRWDPMERATHREIFKIMDEVFSASSIRDLKNTGY